ncbi:LysM peptidoglycan-binding domain-containing protein [Microvirga massiliensis]|uniref:LysM peptidoglycan-binding domain-containing protein n=1 Tax=Microvirga massiliensis TaxID=1033741 RepID=UPI00069B5CC3|nr:LysM peptidoglycan-binding domain-containing protein [Microvirga massiliensis]
MVILIGIEGAKGDARVQGSGYEGSFIHRMVMNWPDQGSARYVAGPKVEVGGITSAAVSGFTHVMTLYSQPDVCGVILAGYSRGGAAAIVAAKMLERAGITVDCLALFDAIDRDYTADTTKVSNNVRLTVHGRRTWSSGSRRGVGNCPWIIPNEAYQLSLPMTHWGMSGVPLFKGLPPGVKPTDFVTEPDWNPYATNRVHVTNVKWQDDLNLASLLWSLIWARVYCICLGCKGCDGTPTGGISHTVASGESLSLIAGNYYKDVLLWPLIYDANVAIIGNNPNLIQPNQRLVVPDIKKFTKPELDKARSRASQVKILFTALGR